MTQLPINVDSYDLETVIAEFEQCWKTEGDAAIPDFLPDETSPEFASVLEELVRTDIEIRWANGKPQELDDYLTQFPDHLREPSLLRNIAFEEFRVKNQYGQDVTPQEYSTKYQVDVEDWMSFHPGSSSTNGEPTRVTKVVNPQIGETICGFQILDQLGSGASGSVFIAKQRKLSDRLVAIKVSPITTEPEILAQLQHTNIVPIFSVTRELDRQVFCMPLLGVVTLSEVIDQHRRAKDPSLRPQQLITTVAAKRAPTLAKNLQAVEEQPNLSTATASIAPGVHLRPRLSAMTGETSTTTWGWFFSKIAEGLVHAHDNDIVHRDLKPENILIADNGQPLILDFHLSTSRTGHGTSLIGGTLPYMSPEQLRSLSSGQSVDARSDIYSFGVMLFQTMTGKLPFPSNSNGFGLVVNQMIEERKQCASENHSLSGLSPALASIIKHCLEYNLDQRYQNTRHLLEDLNRWLEHRPLKHAKNVSLRERTRNWMIRHPRLSSASTIGILSLAILSVAAFGFWQRGQRIAKLDALEQSRTFIAEVENHIPRLAAPAQDFRTSQQQYLNAIGTLKKWNADSQANLTNSTMFANLESGQQKAAMQTALHLHYWIRDAAKRLKLRSKGSFAEFNESTVSIDPPFEAPLDDNSLLNRFLTAAAFQQNGEFDLAMDILEPLAENESDRPYVWLLKGNVLQSLGRLEEAEACFTVCIGLVPNPDWGYAQRGLSRFLQREYSSAIQDFTQAIELDDSFAHYYLNRGLCQMAKGCAKEAEADFTRALALQASETRVYFLRSRIRNALGDQAGATQDFQTGLKLEPTDELSWIARGVARIGQSPKDAVADFKSAVATNPRSRTALQNIAHVYAERLGNVAEAVKTMNRIVEQFPDDAGAQATLGVLLARTGESQAAREAARKALELASDAETQYSVAGIFALLSEENSEHADRALELLRLAASKSPQMVAEAIAVDPDLKLLSTRADFTEFRNDLSRLLKK